MRCLFTGAQTGQTKQPISFNTLKDKTKLAMFTLFGPLAWAMKLLCISQVENKITPLFLLKFLDKTVSPALLLLKTMIVNYWELWVILNTLTVLMEKGYSFSITDGLLDWIPSIKILDGLAFGIWSQPAKPKMDSNSCPHWRQNNSHFSWLNTTLRRTLTSGEFPQHELTTQLVQNRNSLICLLMKQEKIRTLSQLNSWTRK